MSAARFIVKVIAVHPFYDNQGNEYICVEYGFKPPQIPTIVPSGLPTDVSEIVKASKEMMRVIVPPQVQAQMHKYANRLILYLTLSEWDKLQEKYTAGDEFEVIVGLNGELALQKLL